MDDELVDVVLEHGECPAATADLLDLLGGETIRTEGIAVRSKLDQFGIGLGVGGLGGGVPGGLVVWAEAFFDAVGVVAVLVHPENDASAGVEKLAGDHDFVAGALEFGAGFVVGEGGFGGGVRKAADQQSGGGERGNQRQQASVAMGQGRVLSVERMAGRLRRGG